MLLRRWLRRESGTSPLTEERIRAGYRMYWTTTAYEWTIERRTLIAGQVAAMMARLDFEANALERRFRIEALDHQAHSGASLLALAEVLRALDTLESGGDNS